MDEKIELGQLTEPFFGDSPEDKTNNQNDIEQLFLDEVELLNPDIIWFHGRKYNGYRVLKTLKDNGRQVIVSDHPSYKNACTPDYVLKLMMESKL